MNAFLLRGPGRACAANGVGHTVGPRLAVSDDDHGRVERLELRKRVETRRAREVEGTWHQLRPAGTGQRVERAEKVAGNQDASRLEPERSVSGRMAGRVQHA